MPPDHLLPGVVVNLFVFLDIDGVLNGHEYAPECLCGQIHREKVGRLNRILRATGARVVLSSAWRYLVHRGEMNLMGMEWLLRSHGMLAGRLAGITRMDTMIVRPPYNGSPGSWPLTDERGRQISEWIVGEGWTHYGESGRHVVIDDLDLGIRAAGHPFVQTDGKVGLTEDDADRAIETLQTTGSPLTLVPDFLPRRFPFLGVP
jgi:hypothetical protein